MEIIETYDFILNILNNLKKLNKNYISNFYFNSNKSINLIKSKKLFYLKLNNVDYIFKLENNNLNLYYFSPNIYELSRSIEELLIRYYNFTVIIDIITPEDNSFVIENLQNKGFNIYTVLVRMNRVSNLVVENLIKGGDLKVANLEESIEVFAMLYNNFDPIAEQLPTIEDMIDFYKNESILIFKNENKIVGFLIYQLIGITLYLRYWFVIPEFRDKKIGSKLFSYFLNRGVGSKRQLFWVIITNENAVNRYLHYGFKKEKMYNFVLTNKKIKYEE